MTCRGRLIELIAPRTKDKFDNRPSHYRDSAAQQKHALTITRAVFIFYCHRRNIFFNDKYELSSCRMDNDEEALKRSVERWRSDIAINSSVYRAFFLLLFGDISQKFSASGMFNNLLTIYCLLLSLTQVMTSSRRWARQHFPDKSPRVCVVRSEILLTVKRSKKKEINQKSV